MEFPDFMVDSYNVLSILYYDTWLVTYVFMLHMLYEKGSQNFVTTPSL